MASNDQYALGKNVLIVVLMITGLLSLLLITPYNVAITYNASWIKLLTLGLIVVGGVVWFVSRGSLRRATKYLLVVVSIFAISFSSFSGFESYLFQNAGYPQSGNSTNISFSYPDILNVSLLDITQNIKNTPAFRLLSLEHPGEVNMSLISLNDNSVKVIFSMGSSTVVSFDSSDGNPYQVTYVPQVSLLDSSFQPQTPSQQLTPDEALLQMDSLGLQWFYDHAVEVYQNKTGTIPEINRIEIIFSWGEIGYYDKTYCGMMLTITGYGSNVWPCVFHANFQPDGTVNYINVKGIDF